MTTALVAIAVLVPFALAVAFAWYLDGRGRWYPRLAERFCYGVPWGTIVVVAVLLAVYLGLQGGWRHWSTPLVLPFRSWSFLYPTGLLVSGFAHASPGHLIGNLLATIVLGPIAEYAWGHYPPGERHDDERQANRSLAEFADGDRVGEGVAGADRPGTGHGDSSLPDAVARRWPWVRALVLFPAGVLAVGLLTAAFFAGPVVGFSGVVFAFGGFALVRYPVTTLVALLVTSVVSTTYRAITDPVVVEGVSQGSPSPPSWAEIAVQAHALGILVGVVLGLALVVWRGDRPNAGRIFLATLVYGVTRNLWAIYWYAGESRYVLARALGLVLVVGLAVLVTAAATAGDDAPWWTDARAAVPTPHQFAAGWVAAVVVGVASAVGAAWLGDLPLEATAAVATVLGLLFVLPVAYVLEPTLPIEGGVELELPSFDRDATTRLQPLGGSTAFVVLGTLTIAVAATAIVPNLVTLGDDPVPGEGAVEVEDYAVTYEEGVRNRQIPVIDLPGLREQTTVSTSGLIVVSERRHVWSTVVSRQYLQSEGRASVTVGGIGWRETVDAERTGWNVVGNGSVYVVDVSAAGGEERVRSFASQPRTAEPRVAGHDVTVAPDPEDGFLVRVATDDELVGEERLPDRENETTVGDLALRTEEVDGRTALFAVDDDTRVRIATRERY